MVVKQESSCPLHCRLTESSTVPVGFHFKIPAPALGRVGAVTVAFSHNKTKGHTARGLGWEKGVSQPGRRSPRPALGGSVSGNICIPGSSFWPEQEPQGPLKVFTGSSLRVNDEAFSSLWLL